MDVYSFDNTGKSAPEESPLTYVETLAAPTSLGLKRTIQAPDGWRRLGWVVDDPLWILPKSRLRWQPPDCDSVSLHWELSPQPLPADLMSVFITCLIGRAGPLSPASLYLLHPGLIRISPDLISEATIVSLPLSGQHLRIVYYSPERSQRGEVFYSTSENYPMGEFQILGYEGTEPDFQRYLPVATRALQSYTILQVDDREVVDLARALIDAEPEMETAANGKARMKAEFNSQSAESQIEESIEQEIEEELEEKRVTKPRHSSFL